ncbi:ras-related and estrogen-regulated growth inhibitor-like [Hydractinia symbiolongicarpus]|uniref:ras-related and estrogen-regulated growth inhibitor-like n=1 Tax=Hydractinia symbiolongicarpus TaxID=13093 RepID=UPI00254D40BF|nr:ras-related and estrogen-regulated growth inhibitor-like [Hydractinia symbiolongicarpus]XP_057296616.1 ras-related and estrogen-regulated growth inhibitor-like [Hydractinia symbiolongicarpus]XP_057296617.1 ras-related and estrogen-regulated growth inhibitor-like [Hydractinia symbiolongicarpus]
MHQSSSTKIIVLGATGVGKTALVIRCLTGQFFQHYISGSDTAYHFTHGGVSMDIVDSSGKNDALLSYANGIVLVYSITDRESFRSLQALVDKVRRVNLQNVNIVVIGTKCDKQKHRVVSTTEAEDFALSNGCTFHETSSYIPKYEVKDIFINIAKRVNPRKRTQSEVGIRSHIRDTFRGFLSKRRDSTGNML